MNDLKTMTTSALLALRDTMNDGRREAHNIGRRPPFEPTTNSHFRECQARALEAWKARKARSDAYTRREGDIYDELASRGAVA